MIFNRFSQLVQLNMLLREQQRYQFTFYLGLALPKTKARTGSIEKRFKSTFLPQIKKAFEEKLQQIHIRQNKIDFKSI